MRFSRQEHWSRWPFPSPGDLPDPGIEPASPAMAGGPTAEPQGSPSRLSSCYAPPAGGETWHAGSTQGSVPTGRGPSHAAGGSSSRSWPRAALEMSGKERATLAGGEVRADPLRRFVLDPRLTFIQAAELSAPSKGKQDLLPSCHHTHPRTRSACRLCPELSRPFQAGPLAS